MLLHADFLVRFSGARGLAYRQQHNPKSLRILREGLRLDDPDQVVFAADALAALGPPALAALPDLYDAIGRLQKAELRGIGMLSIWRSLERCVHEIGAHDRAALEQGLSESGYEGAMRRVADLLAARYEKSRGVADPGARTYIIAIWYVFAGDHDRSMEWLERAFEVRDPGLPYVSWDPHWDPMRSDPRFQDLLRRMNLPQAEVGS